MEQKQEYSLSLGVDPASGEDKTCLSVVEASGEVVQSFVLNEAIEVDGKKFIMVQGDVLLPMLAYLRKFFRTIQDTNRNAPSRAIPAAEFEMLIRTRGFSPEDFNTLMSLNNSIGTELAAMLDRVETPQMSGKPKVDGRYIGKGGREHVPVLPPREDRVPRPKGCTCINFWNWGHKEGCPARTP